MGRILEFANAMAALNCTGIGARGHIGTAEEATALMSRAERRQLPEFADRAAVSKSAGS